MKLGIRLFLGFSALIWFPYGVYCFFQPSYPMDYASLSILATTGNVEVRAMYGGLQAAIGLFALAALFRSGLVRPALLMFAFLCTGLWTCRLAGGMIEGELSSYTLYGLCFEVPSSLISIFLCSRLGKGADAGGGAES